MKIIGLISGTSADGIDAALCEIEGAPPRLGARIITAATIPYEHSLRERVLDACKVSAAGSDVLCQLNVDLGEAFAAVSLDLINRAGLSPAEVDLIGSHGQTVWHNVLLDGRVSATLQLTDAAVLAERTGITTISDFRARDVAAGGQGAPLVAYLDWVLLRHPKHWRAIQNIGGIGNVTFLPPLNDTANVGEAQEDAPLAFDTGPGNVLIDTAITYLTGGAQTYDQGGMLAQQGQVDVAWLEELLEHPYYRRTPPKTTGRELFSSEMGEKLVTTGQQRGLSTADIVATLTQLTVQSITAAYRDFAPAPIDEVILAGGGQHNAAIVDGLRQRLAPVPVSTHEDIGIASDYKEALLFALLAHETWYNRPGTLPALTGARRASVLGSITPGENYIELIRRTWGSQ
jgi:anhydro-N-acetylmuramic acid kinase